jgi:hypothetical protein
MKNINTREILEKLGTLCTELADLAFTLDRRGRRDAADITMMISTRVADLRAECVAPNSEPVRNQSARSLND